MMLLMVSVFLPAPGSHYAMAGEYERKIHAEDPTVRDVGAIEKTYLRSLDDAEEAGRNTDDARGLARQADQAMARGDTGKYLEYMQRAIDSLQEETRNDSDRERRVAHRSQENEERSPSVAAEGPAGAGLDTRQTVLAKLEQCQRLLDEATLLLRDRTSSSREPLHDPHADSPYAHSPFGIHAGTSGEWIKDPHGEAKDLGAHWDMYMPFIWGAVEPELGSAEYDWSSPLRGEPSYDERMRAARPDGFVVARILALPRLRENSFLPVDIDKYVQFVRATVERYDGDGYQDMPGLEVPIKHWTVDNEPAERGENYPELMKITYRAVKEADPAAKVIMGGTVGPAPGLGPHAQYLRTMAGNYVDIFDIHWFGHARGDYRELGEYVRDLRRIFVKCGYPEDFEIWMTEVASYSGKPSLDYERGKRPDELVFQSEALQAADILKRYVYGLSLGIKKMFLVQLFDGFNGTGGYFDLCGLIFDGKYDHDRGYGVRKPAYYTYKLMTEKLEGSDWDSVRPIELAAPNVYAYQFTHAKSGKHTHVLWWDWFEETSKPKGKQHAVSLPLSGRRATVTTAVTDTDGRRTVRHMTTRDGVLTFNITEHPVFVEE